MCTGFLPLSLLAWKQTTGNKNTIIPIPWAKKFSRPASALLCIKLRFHKPGSNDSRNSYIFGEIKKSARAQAHTLHARYYGKPKENIFLLWDCIWEQISYQRGTKIRRHSNYSVLRWRLNHWRETPPALTLVYNGWPGWRRGSAWWIWRC